MKIDLRDTTFIIPIRIDSLIRLENLLLTFENLNSNFNTNIIIIEASGYCNKLIESLLGDKICYQFKEDKDPIFHRTRYLNFISAQVETDIIGIWDSDVIIEPIQIIKAVEQIRQKKCDVAYPYDGRFFDTSDILRDYYYVNRDIGFLKKNEQKMKQLYSTQENPAAVGGAFLISAKQYQSAGMENEDFYGWGPEDGERYYRWISLGYKIFRSKGCLFHLSHPRDINGGVGVSTFSINKKKEVIGLIINSTKDELKEYIENMRT